MRPLKPARRVGIVYAGVLKCVPKRPSGKENNGQTAGLYIRPVDIEGSAHLVPPHLISDIHGLFPRWVLAAFGLSICHRYIRADCGDQV
jgi:hypothetical protein